MPAGFGSRVRATGSIATLGSAAVFAVYAAGYSMTQAANQRMHEQFALLDVTPTVAPAPARPVAILGQREPAVQHVYLTPQSSDGTGVDVDPLPSASADGAPPVTPTEAYKDGTYVARAEGGHGQVEVTLKINGGAIVSAEITSCLTRYPCSKIKALPGRVIARQSAAVDYISGASDSSRAFRLAVIAALKQAHTG